MPPLSSQAMDKATPTEGRDERRRKHRPAAENLTGKVRRTSGMRDDVRLLDLTPGGCRIAQAGYRAGEKLWISIGGLNPIVAEVRWTSQDSAGLQFESPLYPAIAEHLLTAQVSRTPPRRAQESLGESLSQPGTPRAGWIAELRNPYRR